MGKWLNGRGWIIDEGYWDYPSTSITNCNVHDNVRRFTGLLDSDGNRIFREPNEIGFGRNQVIYSVES